MRSRDIMVTEVVTARPDETVGVAAARMQEQNVGCLVIEDGQPIRMITDRDLLGCISGRHDPHECQLTVHMNTHLVTVSPDEDVLRVTQRMAERKIKRVPVVKNGRLVGLLSFSDVSQAMNEQTQVMWQDWVRLVALVRTDARHQHTR